MEVKLLILLVFGILFESVLSDGECGTLLQEGIFDQLFEEQDYNKNFRPTPGEPGDPTVVTFHLYVMDYLFEGPDSNSYNNFNGPFEWTANLFFRMEWNDPRLQYTDPTGDCPKFKYLLLATDETIETVWTPDLYFDGILSSFRHQELDRYNRFVRIYPNGDVTYSAYVSLTIPCYRTPPRGLPFCTIIPEMYSSEKSDVELIWAAENAVEVDPDRTPLNAYTVREVSHEQSSLVDDTGEFSQLLAHFEIVKNTAYGQPQYYAPPQIPPPPPIY